MKQDPDPRAAYWNESYARYWRARVAESGAAGVSDVQKGDQKTEGDWTYGRLFDAHPFRSGTVLDVGCAWGRMFPLLFERGLKVSGVDISEAMTKLAMRSYRDDPRVDRIATASAEDLPFGDNIFDNLLCVAVFDATYQHKALAEFARVLKPGGRLYLTGKYNHYHTDDEAALAAEIGARKKRHPNYFTDVGMMLEELQKAGCVMAGSYFFPRRGDFASFSAQTEMPGRFYEWAFVIDMPATATPMSFPKIADTHSLTFNERDGSGA